MNINKKNRVMSSETFCENNEVWCIWLVFGLHFICHYFLYFIEGRSNFSLFLVNESFHQIPNLKRSITMINTRNLQFRKSGSTNI